MNKPITSGFIALALLISAPTFTRAQGTIYLSNLGATPSGSLAVASDAWVATDFSTGTNAGGYILNSIQLGMADASGAPSGFSVMLYTDVGKAAPYPGTSLGSLSGSENPSTTGVYTYTPTGDLLLSARTAYYIVVSAGTPAAEGAYRWNYAGTWSYNRIDGWNGIYPYLSSDGSSWTKNGLPVAFPLFGVNATPEVPEPSGTALLLLGGFWVARRGTLRRRA